MSSIETLTPAEIVHGIAEGFRQYIENEERRGPSLPRDYVYASAWRACTRQMALEMLEPDKLPPWPAHALANFRRGRDRERDLLADFTRAGRNAQPPFEVVGREERFTLRDHKGRVVIVGKVDAQLQVGRRKMPLEVKSWNPNLVARIERFDDLFNNRWTKAGAHQLLAYLLAMEEPLGFLLLDRNGLPLLLDVELDRHLERIEDFLYRAETALDARQGLQPLPPYIQDATECKHCGFFGSICQPPSFTAGAELIVEEDIIQKLERRHELEDAAEEYEALDKEIKSRFRGIDMAVAGNFLLEGKWQRSTKYDVPEDVRNSYKVVDPKGKFLLKVTHI